MRHSFSYFAIIATILTTVSSTYAMEEEKNREFDKRNIALLKAKEAYYNAGRQNFDTKNENNKTNRDLLNKQIECFTFVTTTAKTAVEFFTKIVGPIIIMNNMNNPFGSLFSKKTEEAAKKED